MTVENQESEVKAKYKIVDSSESDPLSNKISIESPLSKSLMGKTKQDLISVKTPNGTTIQYKILRIS